MQSFVVTVVVLAVAAVTSVQAKCEGGCSVPVSHYVETGCEPVFAQPGDCCPTHYNCAQFEGRAADKCYYKGQVYNKGDRIENTEGNCLASCFCNKNGNDPLSSLQPRVDDITCAHIDCPEFLGAGGLLGPGCYRAYELNQCCSKGTVCPPFDKVAKCEVKGKTYYEGQKWYSQDDKLKCVCKPGFKGKLEAPFCSEVNCGIELLYTGNIKSKCAPVFYGSNGGCPIQWECFKEGETVLPNQKGDKSEQKCSYGEKQLNIGDKLILKPYSVHSPQVDCECKIPPLVTCIQKPHDS